MRARLATGGDENGPGGRVNLLDFDARGLREFFTALDENPTGRNRF